MYDCFVKQLRMTILGLTLMMLLGFWWYYPDNNLRVIACDVGQGDAYLIQRAFTQIIIDGGPGDRLLPCLARYVPFWDRQIELVVLTHPQADHFSGLVSVFERYTVDTFFANGVIATDPMFERLVAAVRSQIHLKTHSPKAGDQITIGDIEGLVLWPETSYLDPMLWQCKDITKCDKSIVTDQRRVLIDSFDDLNNVSISLQIGYKSFSSVFTGDIGHEQELAIIDSGLLGPATVIKVPHHGSKYSSSMEILRVLNPDVALISVGSNNSFGHPTDEALARLEQIGAKILRTDQNGDLVVATDGQNWWLE